MHSGIEERFTALVRMCAPPLQASLIRSWVYMGLSRGSA